MHVHVDFSNLLPNVVRMMEASAVLKAQLISSGNKSFAFSFNNFFYNFTYYRSEDIVT